MYVFEMSERIWHSIQRRELQERQLGTESPYAFLSVCGVLGRILRVEDTILQYVRQQTKAPGNFHPLLEDVQIVVH